jgi:hypothetical protein
MRLILTVVVGAALVAFAGGARPAAVWETFQQIYPGDPQQRQALDECFMEDHRFDRFDRTAREACYRRSAAARNATQSGRAPQGNFVDLWRAAGQGRMPRNDVRFEEHMAHYYHPVDAGRTR